MEQKYCPNCGQPNVSVGLDYVLRETFPQVRNHVCRLSTYAMPEAGK